MPRTVNVASAALALALASRAAAQTSNATYRDLGAPLGIALPVVGAAAAEEPTALSVNPAGIGFVRALTLDYFHEGGATAGSDADGVYGANGFGPFGFGLSLEWVRPGPTGPPRYRKTTFGFALTDGRAISIAADWSWWASHDAGLDDLSSFGAGLTWRPMRHLSLAAAADGWDAHVAGRRLAVRYDFGAAVRILDDGLTLAADLLANDRARNDFYATHLALGVGAELRAGLGVMFQLQIPIRSGVGDTAGFLTLAYNEPHAGILAGGAAIPAGESWLAGLRVSSQRYRSDRAGREVGTLDLQEELSPRRILFFTLSDQDPYGALLQRLERARSDPEIAALLLEIDDLPVSYGRVDELRTMLARIREKKPVLAYLTGGGTREYFLATAASAIASPPGAPLFVNGISTSQLFLKGGLDRLGIAVEVVKAGAFKSATEPLVRTEPSPEAREMTNALLDDLFGRIVSGISKARRLPEARVRELVDRGLFTSEEAAEAGLVDSVLWPDELQTWARAVTGRGVRLGSRYDPSLERAAQRWGRPSVISVIRVEGMIASGRSRRTPFDGIAGADTVGAQIHRAADDREVAAIVLRIDSPGGDGLASDLIWREVIRARRKGKPVVASMGDLAASGGYLVAVGADEIIAEPSTLTGSIGVFALKPDLSGLLEKISVHREGYARGENAQLTSIAKPWSQTERRVVEQQIATFYGLFVDRVTEGRRLPRADVLEVAGGRVWTGRQALERHLVDRVGTLEDAIVVARDRAGLDAGSLLSIRRVGDDGGLDVGSVLGGALAQLVDAGSSRPDLAAAGRLVPQLRVAALLAEMGTVLALPMPWIEPVTAP